ncbi:hypothetical protein BC628DRAFT_1400066 [Trametes gibbosa]|nr:hypothetical protein BC628DRAFT_1400066 [Trametes gibbosa]
MLRLLLLHLWSLVRTIVTACASGVVKLVKPTALDGPEGSRRLGSINCKARRVPLDELSSPPGPLHAPALGQL